MATPGDGDFIWLEDVRLWYRTTQPGVIHLTINDPDLHHPDTDDGAWLATTHNPRSANYHPANFNRFGPALRLHGKSAPTELAVEGPRRLDKRGIFLGEHARTTVTGLLDKAATILESEDSEAYHLVCTALGIMGRK